MLGSVGGEDCQLKVQGSRGEPGEVEAAARSQPAVRDCLVCAEAAPGGSRRLGALVVPERPAEPAQPAEILAHLRARLPYYMVPGQLHVVPGLPLTANGKVDVAGALAMRAAPAPAGGAGQAAGPDADGPEGHVAPQLDGAGAELLGRDRVGPGGDFFALGGACRLGPRPSSP